MPQPFNGSMAITTNGQLWTWGYNGQGALGDGTLSNRLAPARPYALSNTAAAVVAARVADDRARRR